MTVEKVIVKSLLVIAYTTEMWGTSGTYRLEVGELFYIGSTKDLGRRLSDHTSDLRGGRHWIKELQAAFDAGGEVRMFLIQEYPEKPNDKGSDHRKRLRMHEQRLLDPLFGTAGCVNKSSSSGYNATISEVMRAKWADPEWRANTGSKIANAQRGRVTSTETRAKMAEAKRGSKNVNARAVVMWFKGERFRFATVTEAAAHFGVSQQLMHQWLGWKIRWPGEGRTPRLPYRHLIGLRGCFEDARQFEWMSELFDTPAVGGAVDDGYECG